MDDVLGETKRAYRQAVANVKGKSGAANGTINRELSALKRAFSLATGSTPPKILFAPRVGLLRENNVRKGFFQPEQFSAVLKHLPEHPLRLHNRVACQ